MRRSNTVTLAGGLLIVASCGLAKADDLFDLSAVSTSGPPVTASSSGSTLVDLVKNLVNSDNQFSALDNQGFAANLTYAGVQNAVQITRNAAGTQATVVIPSTGLSKTFTGTSKSDLEDQIVDYIKKNGANEWSKFLREINKKTFVGVADGNPLATTAFAANSAYRRFGLEPSQLVGGNTIDLGDGSEVRFDIDGGVSKTDSGDGYFAGGTISSKFHFGSHLALSLAAPFMYREVEKAKIFDGGFEVALPVTIINGENTPIRWTLTPAGAAYIGGSYDLAAGGVITGVSVTSSFSWMIRKIGLTFTMANQYGTYQGVPIDISEFKFDTDVDQQILKNGLMVTQKFGDGFVDAGVTYTNFLNDAAMDHYWSPTVGVGVNFGESSGLRLAYNGDFGDGYRAHGGTLQLWFSH